MPAASEGVTGFPPGEVSPSTNTAVSSDSYTSFIPQEGKEGQEFYKFERLILQAVVRYGEKIMCNLTDEEGNEVPVTVIEYVINDLKEDDLAFHNPLHRQILTEAATHIHDAGFIAERYFLAHPDQTKMCIRDRYLTMGIRLPPGISENRRNTGAVAWSTGTGTDSYSNSRSRKRYPDPTELPGRKCLSHEL